MSKSKLNWVYRRDENNTVDAYLAEKGKYKAVVYQPLKDKDGNPIAAGLPFWLGFVEYGEPKEWADTNTVCVDPEAVQAWCERKIFDLEMAESGKVDDQTILQSYGFVSCGKWFRSSTVQSGITFELTIHAKDRVVYAFVVDKRVHYVGICEKATTTLEDRMKRYKSRTGSGTNERIALEIQKCLTMGKVVEIFALKPNTIFNYEGLFLDFSKRA